MEEVFIEWIYGLESWCKTFNEYCLIIFFYLKCLFVLILFMLGILTLLKLRRVSFQENFNESKENTMKIKKFKKFRLILGSFYIFMAFGIAFNFFTFLLIWILEPLPDKLIFYFVNFNGDIDPYYMNRIIDISVSQYEHEKIIYYVFGIASFFSVFHIIFSFWMLLNNRNEIIYLYY